MKRNTLKEKITIAFFVAAFSALPVFPVLPVHAQQQDSMDELIKEHEALIQTLKGKRSSEQKEQEEKQKKQEQKQDELRKVISDLQEQLAVLRSSQKELGEKKEENEMAKRTIQSLTDQIAQLERELRSQQEETDRLMKLLDRMEDAEIKQQQELEQSRERARFVPQDVYDDGPSYGAAGLVNPGPQGNINYTQDAANAQGNSTVTFSFAPNQLYKIYCRVGFLTDIVLKKGEKISFVGGGDTSAWALDSTTVDDTPHLYIKPTVDTSSTNLIVTTNKRSYHILLNTSSSYNPMVKWHYGQEDKMDALLRKEKDEKTITSTIKGSLDNLNFSYNISGNSGLKPEMVFDDGEKTFIKFKNPPNRIPTLFIKEYGKKEASIANYKIKDSTYIVDRLVKELELRFSEDEVVKIRRKS